MKLPTYRQIPFILQFAWNPFMALDLTDDDDFPDHDKILPTLATAGIIFLAAVSHPLTSVVAIAVLAASFGFTMFRTFLEAKQYGASAADSSVRTIVEQLAAQHKQDPGA